MSEEISQSSILLDILQEQRNVSMQLGLLQSNTATLINDRERSDASRKIIHEKLDILGNRISSCEFEVTSLKKTVDNHETARVSALVWTKAIQLISNIGYVIVAIITAIVVWIIQEWEVLHRFVGRIFK